ncbi:DEAD/DEAH box helicase [Brachybacterium sp. DNPG3]
MPSHLLHLVADDDLGPALWAREQRERGTRPVDDMSVLAAEAPPELVEALSALPATPRHRVRLPGRGDAEGRRVPAVPLDDVQLLALVEGTAAVLHRRFEEAALDTVAELVGGGTPAKLGERLAAMPDLLGATILDLEAQRLVAERHLRVVALERFGRALLAWHAPGEDRPPLLHALVDARARRAFAAHLERTDRAVLAGARATDPSGVLAALSGDHAVRADVPARRRIAAAFERHLASARVGVTLSSSDSDLVVRLFEPPLGTAWPLQTCLREADGTVHPIADLRAVGDLTAAGAAEASAAIMRLAPTVRAASVDETGVDWLLTTAEASAFLAYDTPALEEAGVTVLLPRDWTKQRTTLRPQEADEEEGEKKRASGVGLGAMASFRWRVAVGDVELTEEEIEEIREAQTELVRLRGQWVRLDATTLRAAERFLDAFAARTRSRRAAVGEDGRERPIRADERRDPRRGAPGTAAGALAGGPVVPPPAEIRGEVPWAEMFSMLLSGDSAGMDLGAATRLAGAAGLGRLMPGASGAVPHPQPTTLQAQLRPYQLDGLNWMWALHRMGLGGILADDMGLGKTMQVLALLCREREGVAAYRAAAGPDGTGGLLVEEAVPAPASGSPGPTLLVCPMSVVGAWQREAARFAPHLAVHVHHGGDRLRDESFAAGAADIDLVITTYSLLARDLPLLTGVDWHRIVYDEAQHLKNPGTQVSRAAGLLTAPHRLALTGTPVENRLADLHALMEVVSPGLLGSASSFRQHIADPIEDEGDESAISRLKFVTSPFVLRRVKTDRSIIEDLPEKTELTRVVNLTPEQAGLYEALVAELMTDIDQVEEKKRRSLVVSTLTRLKQVCNHPAHYLGDGSALLRDGEHRSGKLELVDDLLATAFADGEKALVFTQFTTFGHLLVPYWEERFAEFGIEVPFLHGGVPKPERDAMVARFQERADEPGVMLLSLRAGGTGLTLTAANHVVHLDRWWNPAVENQATDRAFRIGQRRDVTVHKLVSAGTVEERIDQVLQDKQMLADMTVAPGEEWLADLSDESLRGLLALDDDAVPEREAPRRGGRR